MIGQSNRNCYDQTKDNARITNQPFVLLLYPPDRVILQSSLYQLDSTLNAKNIAFCSAPAAANLSVKYRKNTLDDSSGLWLFIHPDGTVIQSSQGVTNAKDLEQFITSSTATYQSFNQNYSDPERSDDYKTKLAKVKLACSLDDTDFGAKRLDAFIKGLNTNKLTDDQFKELIDLGSNYAYSKRLYKLIQKNQDRAIELSGEELVSTILSNYILYELRNKRLLEPYYVWNKYENELGVLADSLYRVFALHYFGRIEPDQEGFYNEAFDFLYLYPRAEWEFQDVLFNYLIPRTKIEDDLNALLDLISFQIFLERGYKQLDYKAAILYKLGEKERALSLIEEVNSLALQQSIKYKSLLYQLN